MTPSLNRNHAHLAYLEPPHSHDPASVSTLAVLPASTIADLPFTVQSALYNLQQSTSIMYASYIRFQELLQERFDRLKPSIDVDGEVTFSEQSFFNYVNSLEAERTYLLSGAHTDWRHKASVVRAAMQPYRDLLINHESAYPEMPSSVLAWWKCLQSAVESWCDYARTVHVPDFEDTIGEYLAIQKHTPVLGADLDDTPLETPLATPTPTLGYEPEPLRICEIKDTIFGSGFPSDKFITGSVEGLGLIKEVGIDHLASSFALEFPLRAEGKAREDRKDSGVGIAG